ncbi:proline-rich receptor-like protein kinase PERK13 [Camellia sinensis]|uniref:proline-rich receptor-like protein kinase PERK13 n=1 Tax=Camellia sinensis TaxID=4442 RepID=UPI0010359285|nr:proline-rich receptor-like protein kinase PERK13 [Camellia sinensis]
MGGDKKRQRLGGGGEAASGRVGERGEGREWVRENERGSVSAKGKRGGEAASGRVGGEAENLLNDGREIAVKKLSQSSNQGKKEFTNEAKLLARVQHHNVVNLLDYCAHDVEKLLVYEYVTNESLDKLLFTKNSPLLMIIAIHTNELHQIKEEEVQKALKHNHTIPTSCWMEGPAKLAQNSSKPWRLAGLMQEHPKERAVHLECGNCVEYSE